MQCAMLAIITWHFRASRLANLNRLADLRRRFGQGRTGVKEREEGRGRERERERGGEGGSPLSQVRPEI